MIKRISVLVVLISLALPSFLFAGAREASLLWSDPQSLGLLNPASVSSVSGRVLIGSVSRYQYGLPEAQYMRFSIFGGIGLNKLGSLGLGIFQESLNGYTNSRFHLGGAHRFSLPNGVLLSAGAYGKLILNRFDRERFHRFDEDDPIFSSGYTSYAFSADLGVGFLWRDFGLGLSVRDVNEPNLSFASHPSWKLPMVVSGGISYRFRDMFSVFASVCYTKAFDEPVFSMGMEGSLSGFALRAATDVDNLGFGAGYMFGLGKISRLGVDYAVVLPLTELSKVGVSSHELSLRLVFPPPTSKPKRFPDLTILSASLEKDRFALGDSTRLTFVVANIGKKKSDSFKVTSFLVSPDTANMLFSKKLPLLSPGERKEVSFLVSPDADGEYRLIINVDDTGELFPEVSGSVTESNEENNTSFLTFSVFRRTTARLEPLYSTLELLDVSVLADEAPVIPVVFFERGSPELPERFFTSLRTVAERIKCNPDIRLVIKGYIDPESEQDVPDKTGLARLRAENIRSKLIEFGAPSSRITVAAPDRYDVTEQRIVPRFPVLTEKDRRWISEENRRGEIVSEFMEPFPTSVVVESPDRITKLSELLSIWKRILSSNPDVQVLVGANKGDAPLVALDRMEEVRSRLNRILGTKPSVMFVEDLPPGKIGIYLNADHLLYSPREYFVSKDIRFGDESQKENIVRLELATAVPIDTYFVSVVDDAGNLVKELGGGEGTPPMSFIWDWTNCDGSIVNPERRYFVRLELTDSLGSHIQTLSPPLEVKTRAVTEKRESWIIIQFVFDEVSSVSYFFDSRLEEFVQRLVELARSGKPLVVRITGHTDKIGRPEHNRRLSVQRAEQKYEEFSYHLMHRLGISRKEELDRWLAEHDVKIEVRGVSSDEPLTVMVTKDGRVEESLLGDDNLPEGRSMNRRVTIEFITGE